MATKTLGTLVVDLIAKIGGFESDMGRAAKIADRRGRDIADSLGKINVAAGAALAAAATTGAIFIKKAIDRADELNRIAKQIGIGVEPLSKLEYAARLADVSLESLQAGIRVLVTRQGEAIKGNEKYAATFKGLGIDIKDSAGNFRDTTEVLGDFADLFSKLPDGPLKSKVALEAFGRQGQQLIPLLNEGREGIKRMTDEAEKFGLTVTEEAGAAADEFNDNLTKLYAVGQGVAQQLATSLGPQLKDLSNTLASEEFRKGFATIVGGAITATAKIAGLIGKLGELARFGGEEVAARLNGPSAGDRTRIEQQLEEVEAQINSRLRNGDMALGGLNDFRPFSGIGEIERLQKRRGELIVLLKATEDLEKAQGGLAKSTAVVNEEINDGSQAMQAAIDKVNSYFGASAKAADAAKDEKKVKQELRELNADLKELEAQYTRELILNEEARIRATDAIQDYQASLADILEGYDQEFRLIGATAQERERLIDEFQREAMVRQLVAQAQAKGLQLTAEEIALAREQIMSAQQRNRFAEETVKVIEESRLPVMNAVQGLGDAISTALVDGAKEGGRKLKDVMKDLLRDLINFWLKQRIIIPLQQQVMGGVQGQAGGGGVGGVGGFGGGQIGGAIAGAAAGYQMGGWTGAVAGTVGGVALNAGIAAGAAALTSGAGLGAAFGAGASAAFAAVPVVGWIVAAVAILATVLRKEKPPDIRLGGSGASIRSQEGSFNTELGTIRAGSRGIKYEDFIQPFQQFDAGIVQLVSQIEGGAEQLDRIRNTLNTWEVDLKGDAATVENVLGSRFDAILGTFSQDIQDFVNEAEGLEERIARLGDITVRPQKLRELLGGLRAQDMLEGMPELDRSILQLNQQFDAIRAQATALGATEANLAEIEAIRGRALDRLTRSELEATEALTFSADAAQQYADAVTDLDRQLAELGGASQFQLSLADIAAQYNANVDRLNQLARASGSAAAREQDLARALEVATLQRQKAIAALEQEGRSIAQQLGYGELGALESEIARLEGLASGATGAVSDFGGAITEAAEAARDGIDLLLGNLSPLKDIDKLQIALQGLREGRVSQEQVLEIGKRLYTSGKDYNRLFDQVMAIGSAVGAPRATGGGTAVPTNVSNNAVDARLAELIARRDGILADQARAQRFTQASDLAQVIADLAGARGESFEQIADSLGLTGLDELLEDLNISNVDTLKEYLTALQADSYSLEDIAATVTAGEQLIVDTLERIFDRAVREERGEVFVEPTTSQLSNPSKPGGTGFSFDGTASLSSYASQAQQDNVTLREELALLRETVAELLTSIGDNTAATAEAVRESTGSNTEEAVNVVAVSSSRLAPGRKTP